MTGANDTRAMAMEMAKALALLRAGHVLYADILDAVRETVSNKGEADIPTLVKRLNGALTTYAPRDAEARDMLAKYD